MIILFWIGVYLVIGAIVMGRTTATYMNNPYMWKSTKATMVVTTIVGWLPMMIWGILAKKK